MNIPEFRDAQRSAIGRYQDAVGKAADLLAQELHDLDRKLFEEQDVAVESVPYERAAVRKA